MALTLIEAAKLNSGTDIERTIIEIYAGSSDILMNLPFRTINGGSLSYTREQTLPSVAFRGINESYTASTGVLNKLVESLSIAGGDIIIDNAIIRHHGVEQVGVQVAMKTRSLALSTTKSIIKGDSVADPRSFDGLQTRVTGNQLISAGTTANGAALSLDKLNEAIDQTFNPTHLIMSKAMKRKFISAINNTNIGGYITQTRDEFGRPITEYGGLPILIVDLDETGSSILGFNEASSSGTATSTSIYIVSMGDMGFSGLQGMPMNVQDLGQIITTPAQLTRIEWDMSIALFHSRSATRLQHIGNLAIVA